MYVFELFYRPKISPVSVGHHIGTIIIGQAAIAINFRLAWEKDATIEFILCTVWGKSPKPRLAQESRIKHVLMRDTSRRIRHHFRIPPPRVHHSLQSVPRIAPLSPPHLRHLVHHHICRDDLGNHCYDVVVRKFVDPLDYRIQSHYAYVAYTLCSRAVVGELELLQDVSETEEDDCRRG